MTEKPQSRPEGKTPVQNKQDKPKPAPQTPAVKTETKVVTPSINVPVPSSSNTQPSTPSSSTPVTPSTPPAKEKPVAPKPTKKDEAVAKGKNLHASKKHCMYLCNFIKGKPIDQAITELQEVLKFKRVIPMKGEIPHRSAPGIMSGRYPIKTTQQFIPLLKALKGNVVVNGMELDKTRITYGSATWASRPQKRGGMRFKRSFVVLKAREVPMKESKKQEKKQ
jgi:ribosomal protein L22